MIHDLTFLDAEPEDDYVHCDQCGAEKPDTVGLSLIETEEEEAEEYGFCSLPCLVVFVRKHYSGLVPATPAEAPGPPSGRVSAGIGGTREPVGSGKSPVAPGPSTSDALEWAWP